MTTAKRANTNQLHRRRLMLKPSYAVLQQFQSQKNSTKNLQDLKALLRRLGLSMCLQIESPTIWKLSWDMLKDTLSGTLEVRIQHCLTSSLLESFEARHFTTLRLEEPKGISLADMEEKLIAIIKDSLETLR